jgi:hypothetical protein
LLGGSRALTDRTAKDAKVTNLTVPEKARQSALVVGLVMAACVLGILNSGGYRYGISDQAFYLPAVLQHLDQSLFPRDRALLHAQDRFMLFDDLVARVVQATQLSLPFLFLILFVVGLLVHFSACVALGRFWYRSWWTTAALVFLLTLRHRITRTGVNTLEGYLHPRMLAFAAGSWALVAFLRGHTLASIGLIVVASALHTTTALWFAIWIGVAIVIAERRWRWPMAAAAAAVASVGMWSLWFGPLREQLQYMDDVWLAVLNVKDYLFPTAWPVSAWLINLAYPLIVWIGYRMRRTRSLVHPREEAVVFGALALSGLFLLSLPFVAARLALAVQLQVSRIFWMLELVSAVYLVWYAMEGRTGEGIRRNARWVTIVLALASLSRGAYIMLVEQPERRIIQTSPPENEWSDVMKWVRQTAIDTHVLADPNHAFRYESSERILGQRDVFLEASKDTAVATYSRSIAHRVFERIQALGDFETMTTDRARSLAERYDLNYLITERSLNLPRVYQNARFNVYALQSTSTVNSRQSTVDGQSTVNDRSQEPSPAKKRTTDD